jgi:hypothetical protein
VLTFLFWNINRKPLGHLIAELVEEHQVDILLLAECSIPPGSVSVESALPFTDDKL